MTTWSDVANEMAATTGRAPDDEVVMEAVDALRRTKLQPSFVLGEWQERAANQQKDRT